MSNTVQITQAELKRLGYWEDAKKRFGFTDANQVVTLQEGTTLYKDTPMKGPPPPLACAVCGTTMIPMAGGGSVMCPVCNAGPERFRP